MNKFDVIVIGGGPAGISAGIYSHRAGMNVLVLDGGDSKLKQARKLDNYYGVEGLSGSQLVKKGIEQYKNLGGNYINANVVSIKQDMKEHLFEVKTSKELYFCKSLILCTGSNEKNKTLPELEDYEGTNVSYCAVCDGFFYKGKTVAVIGDGDFAINECEELSRVVEKIYLIAGKEVFLPNLKNVKVVNKKIVDVEGENMVERLVFEDKTKLAVDGVFVALGTMSSSDIAKRLGIVGNGGISVDKNYMTNISGVFAGGDAIGGLFQAAKAVSDGAYAGLGAAKYVKMMEFYSDGEE